MKKSTGTGSYWLFLLTILTTLAACTTTQPEPEPVSLSGPDHGQHGAVDYYNWVLAATPEELRQELSRLENNAGDPANHESLVQQALVAGSAALQINDLNPGGDRRALELLDQFKHHADSAAVGSDYHAIADLWRQILELRLQVSLLREQIEALTTIERKIDNREPQEG